MPRIYTLQQKRHALYLIEQLDSVPAVSLELNIPERTLRDWHYYAKNNRVSGRKNPELTYQNKSTNFSASEMRERLLTQIENLTNLPTTNPREAYFTALAIDHFLQQIRTLSDVIDIIPPELPPEIEEIPPIPAPKKK